jgi:two-component system chemotaxis response regulator CheY
MRFLITEDDFASRKLMQQYLSDFGNCDIAVDGKEAIEAFRYAWDEGKPYDLICLDIMMPNMDGRTALKKIRQIELEQGIGGFDNVKVIMTTALGDNQNILGSFRDGCEAYIVKPIDKNKFLDELVKLGLITPVK